LKTGCIVVAGNNSKPYCIADQSWVRPFAKLS